MTPPTPDCSILITGAASGIGAATARRFIQEGWRVAVNYLDASQRDAATALAAGAPSGRGIAVEGDVTRDADCVNLVHATVAAFGRLDALVNAAGISKMVAHADLHGLSAEDRKLVEFLVEQVVRRTSPRLLSCSIRGVQHTK